MLKRRVALLGTGLVMVGLGVAFLAVGLDTAGQLASAIGALVGVAGCGFSVWARLVDRSRPAQSRDGMSGQDSSTAPEARPPGTAPHSHVDASHAQGLQIGDGNTQYNSFS